MVNTVKKKTHRIDAAFLERAALHYLERFSASRESLRRVLVRKVERAARLDADDPEAGKALIEALIMRFRALGYLDDDRYASATGLGLFRRGSSLRSIRQTLHRKGVDSETIEKAMSSVFEEAGNVDADLRAAVALIRRRRLGPFRRLEEREERRRSDLAALARAGFASAVAYRVISAETPDDLEDMLCDV